jgi:hypothetical protein
MKLFNGHFCGDRDSIFVYNLHVSGPTVMHTFDVILLLLLEQHAIIFACINLLIVHAKTGHKYSWIGISLSACYASPG